MAVTLPLNYIVNATATISPTASPGLTFNQGLIVGSSPVIPSLGGNSRVRFYSDTSAMLTDGFTSSEPEMLAANLYFGQSPTPAGLWVGRQDLTAIATVAIGAAAGTGYVVGDIVTVVQSGASGGQVQITAVASGVPTAVQVIQGSQGTGYAIASNLSTTGGTGTGLELNITAIGETPLQAVTACRIASPEWYVCQFVGTAADADHEAIAAYIQGAQPSSVYFITSGEAGILNGTAGNLAATLQAAKYSRTLIAYSTTQSGAAPNNVYATAGVMGYAMGANTGAAASMFTLMFKQISGVTSEPLTETQVNAIAGDPQGVSPGLSCNVFVAYNNNAYSFMQRGTMCNNSFFDERLQIDMLLNDIQTSGFNLFTTNPVVPQDASGMAMVFNAIAGACDRSKTRGFIAPSGTWTGVPIGTGSNSIATGQTLPNGYAIYAPPISSLSAGQKSSRQLPPVTVALIEAGSGQSLTVAVYVQQ